MKKLYTKYDKRLRQVLGYRAVWEPGAPISLGDVGTVKNGVFVDKARLSDYGIGFRKEKRHEAKLALNAQGVSETLFQGGAEVPGVAALKPGVKAEFKIKFSGSDTYHLNTAALSGEDIDNLAQVGKQIARLSDWPFAKYYVVWRILHAKDFTFLGSLRRNREISFSGSGTSIANYLNSGLSANLSRSSGLKLDLEIIGGRGPVAIGLTRIKKDGTTRDV